MKTKIMLFFLLFALMGLNVQAQIVTSRSMKISRTPLEKTFYVAAGGIMNTLSNSHFGYKPGGEIAVGYEQNFKRGVKFGSQWGVELGATTHGYKMEALNYSSSPTSPAIMLSPFIYSYRIGLGKNKKTWLEPHIGAELDYIFKGSDNREDRYYGNGGPHIYENSYDSRSLDGFDASLRIGLRLWVASRISIDLAYRYGFVKKESEDLRLNYKYMSAGNDWYYTSSNLSDYSDGNSTSLILRVGVKLNK